VSVGINNARRSYQWMVGMWRRRLLNIDRAKSDFEILEHVIGGVRPVRSLVHDRVDDRETGPQPSRRPRTKSDDGELESRGKPAVPAHSNPS
jgi:hypothetical protein